MAASVRQADSVARFGGDEFVVLIVDITDRENATIFAEKIIAKLSAPYIIADLELNIGASIGISLLPEDAENVESLITKADTAMYAAKNLGRNCYCFAS